MKENIVQLAISQFHQFGIRNVSVDDICSTLRISKKTFYQYFKKKEDLIEAIIQNIQGDFHNRCIRKEKDKNSIEILIMNIKEIRKAIEREPFLFWHDLKKYYPALYARYYEIQQEMVRTIFEQNIQRGIAEGFYRSDIDVELLSYFHSVQMRYTFDSVMENQKGISLKRVVDFFIDMMVHLITSETGLKYLEENYFDKIKK
ncbi:MAG: TetR/AcrR family transcriptional regulator [Paludibacter sp.]|nr:TetR/AcrR family transcriptional regulator [Paludibacter sp.]